MRSNLAPSNGGLGFEGPSSSTAAEASLCDGIMVSSLSVLGSSDPSPFLGAGPFPISTLSPVARILPPLKAPPRRSSKGLFFPWTRKCRALPRSANVHTRPSSSSFNHLHPLHPSLVTSSRFLGHPLITISLTPLRDRSRTDVFSNQLCSRCIVLC